MAKKKTLPHGTLHLDIEFTDTTLPDILEVCKEIVEKASEQAKVEGHLDLHCAERVFISDLK